MSDGFLVVKCNSTVCHVDQIHLICRPRHTVLIHLQSRSRLYAFLNPLKRTGHVSAAQSVS